MAYVTVEEARAHLKLTLTDDDIELAAKIEAAEEWAAEFLNRELSDVTVEGDSDADPEIGQLKPSVKLAILQRVEATFYRDPATMEALSKDAREMLYPFRTGLGV